MKQLRKKSHESLVKDTTEQVAQLVSENKLVKNLNSELQTTVSNLQMANFDYERIMTEQTSLMKELNVRGLYFAFAASGLIVFLTLLWLEAQKFVILKCFGFKV